MKLRPIALFACALLLGACSDASETSGEAFDVTGTVETIYQRPANRSGASNGSGGDLGPSGGLILRAERASVPKPCRVSQGQRIAIVWQKEPANASAVDGKRARVSGQLESTATMPCVFVARKISQAAENEADETTPPARVSVTPSPSARETTTPSVGSARAITPTPNDR